MSLLRLDRAADLVNLADPPSQVPRMTEKKRMKLRITHIAGLLAIALVATALQSPANADELVRWNLSDPLDGFSGFGINT
jgi:hypothetical protein